MSVGEIDRRADRSVYLAAIATSLLSFFLYLYTLAPGLTWAHFGADGGELIAAAMVNGVPHPPGYPLYMILLRVWLTAGQALSPDAELAWIGNLFSAFCAAASVGVTTVVGGHLLRHYNEFNLNDDSVESATLDPKLDSTSSIWIWAAVIGLAWATAPLLWKQAIITEVYALHVLLIALLGWALFVQRGRLLFITLPIGFGLAHHLTYVLLLPGVLYWLWHIEQSRVESSGRSSNVQTMLVNLVRAGCKLLPALLIGLLIYVRIPLVASSGPPINWGYPDNWDGFWWLTSASAYRGYLFGVPVSSVFDRIAAWAYNLTSQFTALGLALALLGLSKWDREAPALRNFGLLWLLPISIYAISYYTKDSTIYLLPCMWLLAIWMGVGLLAGREWLTSYVAGSDLTPEEKKRPSLLSKVVFTVDRLPSYVLPTFVALLIAVLAFYRLPGISLRGDMEATTFLSDTERFLRDEAVLTDSIIISSADNETFSLWYGVWGSQQLVDNSTAEATSDSQSNTTREPYLINGALLQFPWYQRQIREQYPDLPGAGATVQTLIRENQHIRPIFFSEAEQIFVNRDSLEPAGPLWRYQVNQ